LTFGEVVGDVGRESRRESQVDGEGEERGGSLACVWILECIYAFPSSPPTTTVPPGEEPNLHHPLDETDENLHALLDANDPFGQRDDVQEVVVVLKGAFVH
jgi:hypothetical protein